MTEIVLVAPAHLSESSQQLYSAVVPSRVASPARIALLVSGLESLDRARQASQTIAREGMTITSPSGLTRVHPLVRVERDCRAQFASVWRRLGMADEPRHFDPFSPLGLED